MDSKRKKRQPTKPGMDGRERSEGSVQRNLWSDQPDMPTNEFLSNSVPDPPIPPEPPPMAKGPVVRKTIQDLLFREGLLAAHLAEGQPSLEGLQARLISQLPQNSLETRTRYAQSVLKWFFPDGLSSLIPRVACAYRDDAMIADLLRCTYLMAEPIVGRCVAECLFPLEIGIRVPAHYLDRFLHGHLGQEPPAQTRKRLKTNLTGEADYSILLGQKPKKWPLWLLWLDRNACERLAHLCTHIGEAGRQRVAAFSLTDWTSRG